MKSYLCVFLCCLFFSGFVNAQNDAPSDVDRSIKKGFSVKLDIGFPGSSYGLAPPPTTDINSGFLIGLQIGNQWYIQPKEEYGFGIMVNWFDFSIGVNTGSDLFGGDLAKATLDFSFLEFGPIGTYKVGTDAAIDAYYNLRPTIMSSAIIDENDDGIVAVDVAITHAIGFGFRYKVFYIGPEIVFGKLKDVDVLDADDTDRVLYISDLKAKHFRMVMGFKF